MKPSAAAVAHDGRGGFVAACSILGTFATLIQL
jgi:hypothetical protein